MPVVEIVARFEIGLSRCIDASGNALGPLPGFAEEPRELTSLYRAMVRTRAFDAKAVSLQRTGRLGTFASSLGQEAVAVGIGSAMAPQDVFLPSFREHGTQLLRGVSIEELLLFWGGDERGNVFAGPDQDFPVCVPVGSHAPHAVGVALAFKLRREARAAVCVFGDGATSKGDVYEALNIAGVWKLPALFVVNNNRWAISIPVERQTASGTLAQKAIAAGMSCEQVDGNDVIAVRAAAEAALGRIRRGEGPHLIEALTYRLSDHTTADDASRYRKDAEVSPHWSDEPVARLRTYLAGKGWWGKDEEESLLEEIATEMDRAVDRYLATVPEPLPAVFDYTYENLPNDLLEQRAAALEGLTGRDASAG